jgi:hypothetical protein
VTTSNKPEELVTMPPLISTDLKKLSNAVTHSRPSMALGVIAIKGQQQTDKVFLVGGQPPSCPVPGTSTDEAPALAGVNVFGANTMLYLAWKVAGKDAIEVRQFLLGLDGFPTDTGSWVSLPASGGKPSNPAASTDAAPAMAVGANNLLYLVWKTPGADAAMAWSVYDGTGWSAPETIPSAKTSAAPALAGYDTSGPGNVRPLCLAFKGGSTDNLYWSLFTPGSATFEANQMAGVSTDTAPAVAAGEAGSGYPYFLIWKPKGESSLSFAPVGGSTAGAAVGQTYTFPQIQTNVAPGASDSYSTTSGFGSQIFDNLTLTYPDKNGDLWQGIWSVVPSAASFPGAGTDNGRTPDEGSNNYILYGNDSCESLGDVAIAITVTSDLDCPKGFSFQLNGNVSQKASNYSRCAGQQCGFQFDSSGNLTGWVNNWVNSKTDTIDTIGDTTSNGGIANLLHKFPSSKIPSGTVMTIKLKYDENLWITSTVFTAVLPNGDKTPPVEIDYEKSLLPGFPAPNLTAKDYMAPVCVLQTVIVGFDNKANADFKTGAGTITLSAGVPLIAGDARPACSGGLVTEEQSNILYGPLSTTPSKSQTQTFCASTSANS